MGTRKRMPMERGHVRGRGAERACRGAAVGPQEWVLLKLARLRNRSDAEWTHGCGGFVEREQRTGVHKHVYCYLESYLLL